MLLYRKYSDVRLAISSRASFKKGLEGLTTNENEATGIFLVIIWEEACEGAVEVIFNVGIKN